MAETIGSSIANAPTRREATAVYNPIPIMDTARFEHFQRIAKVMASCSLVPDTLCMTGDKDHREPLPYEVVFANCFIIVNFSERCGLDPFAVMQCTSLVYGKLCLEGKLVAAIIKAKIGLDLNYEWNDKTGDAHGIRVTASDANGELAVDAFGKIKDVVGTVGEWKTKGNGSPWFTMAHRMLAYRGAREWARLYEPGLMLGVYTDDEMVELADNARASRAVGTNNRRAEISVQNPLSDEPDAAETTTAAAVKEPVTQGAASVTEPGADSSPASEGAGRSNAEPPPADGRPDAESEELNQSINEAPPKAGGGKDASLGHAQPATGSSAPAATATTANPTSAANAGGAATTHTAKPTGSVAQDVGSPAAAASPTEAKPKTPDEYDAYLDRRLAACMTKAACENIWKDERSLRNSCNIPSERLEKAKARWSQRLAELEGGT